MRCRQRGLRERRVRPVGDVLPVHRGAAAVPQPGPAPVTVTAVRWTNLVGLSEIQYRVVHPDHPQEGIGIVHGSPPDGKPSDNAVKLWAKSVALLGAELPTAEADNPLQVLIGFAGTNGSAGPLEIDYTDAEGHPGTAVSLLTKVETKPVC